MHKYALFIGIGNIKYHSSFSRGTIYKIRKDEQGKLLADLEWVSIEQDDDGSLNGWSRRFFILLKTKKQAKLAKLFYS